MTGIAIISADRRFVRITPAPFFSQIGKVSTFNFITGEEAPGGAAGGGGGAGGAGGGAGGAGGGGAGGSWLVRAVRSLTAPTNVLWNQRRAAND